MGFAAVAVRPLRKPDTITDCGAIDIGVFVCWQSWRWIQASCSLLIGAGGEGCCFVPGTV